MCYLEEFINITFVVESVIAQAFIYTITDFMSQTIANTRSLICTAVQNN